MTQRPDDLARFQMDAAERRRLLQLGKIEVADPPDTSAFTREVQLAATSPKKPEPDQR